MMNGVSQTLPIFNPTLISAFYIKSVFIPIPVEFFSGFGYRILP
jgi:hypothetical protein